LISTGRRIAELEHVDDILLFIVDTVRKLLMADFAGVAILDETRANLELRCLSTAAETSLVTEPPQVISNPLIQEVLGSFHSYCSPAGEPAARLQGLCLQSDAKAGSAAIVPLLMENTAMGVMWVARGTEQPFTETDLVWLEGMGDQVEIAIQHGLMTAQLQSLSVVEERGRIAREMHDGLAQVLGYLNLQVQTLGSLLKQGKEAQLQQELAQMRQAVQTANADVRENILSLRTTLSTDTDLASAVEEYLQEFGIQTGIETSLSYEVEGQLQLASMAEVQLVCILQEALTNVRKHARASHVSVSISRNQCRQGEEILMRVQDNGVGYAPSGSKRSFGVQTMRERAQSVSGRLAIQSKPGEGTRVECRLPRLPAEHLPRQSAVIP
jgi:nitrate/nitrite-specific signal transduction histidine kinase